MNALIVKRTVDERKDKSVDVIWIIPRYNQFSSTMFFAALQSSMKYFTKNPDALSEYFDYKLNSANIVVKTHFVNIHMYINFINYMMDNYPELFFDQNNNLKQDGGML